MLCFYRVHFRAFRCFNFCGLHDLLPPSFAFTRNCKREKSNFPRDGCFGMFMIIINIITRSEICCNCYQLHFTNALQQQQQQQQQSITISVFKLIFTVSAAFMELHSKQDLKGWKWQRINYTIIKSANEMSKLQEDAPRLVCSINQFLEYYLLCFKLFMLEDLMTSFRDLISSCCRKTFATS